MNYRYIKIGGSVVWGTNNLTKDDLIRAKNGGYDVILDIVEMKTFNADDNAWEDIEGDK